LEKIKLPKRIFWHKRSKGRNIKFNANKILSENFLWKIYTFNRVNWSSRKGERGKLVNGKLVNGVKAQKCQVWFLRSKLELQNLIVYRHITLARFSAI
jgi:hypothetical protein